MAVWIGRLNGQNSLLFLFVKALRALLEFCFAKAVHLANFVDVFFFSCSLKDSFFDFCYVISFFARNFFFSREGDVVSFLPNQYGVISSSLRVIRVSLSFCVVVCLLCRRRFLDTTDLCRRRCFCVYLTYMLFI